MAVIYGTIGPDKKIGTSGNDLIHGWATGGVYTSPSGNDTLDGAAGRDTLYGGTGNDSLIGGIGNDLLSGNAGLDILNGGAGDDSYIIDSTNDKVTEATNSGTDTVQSYVSYTLGSHIEKLMLIGTGAINGTGNSLNNTIIGNAANNTLNGKVGNDTIDGGLGIDTLIGGTGDDIYVVDSPTDAITEFFNPGYDNERNVVDLDNELVKSSVSYTLSENLEFLILTGSSTISGTGNALNNTIYGNATNNSLYGKGGNDTLSGGLGIDTLIAGSGNDTYYILDSTRDTIVEGFNQGFDTIYSNISYALGKNLEKLALTYEAGEINGTGNTLDNVIEGNNSNNYLDGGGGNDSLLDREFYDNDTLVGGTGNDALSDITNSTLIGGAGDDTLVIETSNSSLIGGTGNDTYVINNIFPTNIITENLDGGVDNVEVTFGYDASTSSYTLGKNLENLILNNYYSPGGNGIGNALDNIIQFSDGYGKNDYLFGDAGNDYLSGNGGNDTIEGGTGNDTITAAVGGGFFPGDKNTFIGGAGADVFRYISPEEGIDVITDFSVFDDTITVSTSVFGGRLTPDAAITPDQFVLGAAAVDKSDRFIYNQNTGALFFDSDGTGTNEQVQFASLSTDLAMTNSNIFVV